MRLADSLRPGLAHKHTSPDFSASQRCGAFLLIVNTLRFHPKNIFTFRKNNCPNIRAIESTCLIFVSTKRQGNNAGR